MNRRAARSDRCECDSQLAGVGADLLKERASGRRCPVRITNCGAGSRIEQSSTVAHRSSQRVLGYQPAEHITEIRSERIARASRLQPEYTATRSRNSNRATPIVAVSE